MHWLKFWLFGYVEASINRSNMERFINIASNHQIHLKKVRIKQGRCYFQIVRKEYKSLLPIARKTGCYPKLHKKYGGYFVLWRLLRHSGLMFGILAFSLLVYILSMFLWEISFEGNYYHTKEQLLSFVNEYGIGFGSRCSEIDCTALEGEIREHYPDISWVSAELHGSRMTIRLRENSFEQKKLPSAEVNSHIIANENGIVEHIIASRGTPMVKVGDAVKKGDILISGVVTTLNESSEVVSTEPVYAEGEVKLKADISYQDTIPIVYSMKYMTGREKSGLSFSLFDKKLFSYIPSIPYERYDIITSSVTWKLSNNLYLPISQDTISCMEYVQSEALYGNSQLSEICYRRFLEAIENYIRAGYELVAQDVSMGILGEECTLMGTVTMIGPFWNRREVLPDELLPLPKPQEN